jgi:hypothetical protein
LSDNYHSPDLVRRLFLLFRKQIYDICMYMSGFFTECDPRVCVFQFLPGDFGTKLKR